MTTVYRPLGDGEGFIRAAMALAKYSLCAAVTAGVIGSAIVVPHTNSDRVNELNSALAAGDKVLRQDGIVYAIQCTGPGQANAFRIAVGSDGNKVVTNDALVGFPQWPLDRLYAHSVPAERCTK